ncbi:hypothetical protein BDF19DRAFT_435579 [Syncephalis fuscata]|nr:hypothetical protein BDF19DRAFT_435579 [Syncephalis fuscata]
MTRFTADQESDFKETFALFDRSGRGQVPLSSLGDLLRSCNQNPTEKQIAELAASANTVDMNGEPGLTYEEFTNILGRSGGFQPPGTFEDFVKGFRVFDKEGTNYISTGELRYVLTSLGEKLKESEVDQLLRIAEKDHDGNINYEEFIKKLMAG